MPKTKKVLIGVRKSRVRKLFGLAFWNLAVAYLYFGLEYSVTHSNWGSLIAIQAHVSQRGEPICHTGERSLDILALYKGRPARLNDLFRVFDNLEHE